MLVTNIAPHEATISWKGLETKQNVSALWVKWRVKKAANSEATGWVKRSINVTDDHYRLTALAPFTSYEVSAYVEFQNWTTSEDAAVVESFKTQEDLPGAPEKLTVTPVSGSREGIAHVNWTAPGHPEGLIVKYKIYYKNKDTGSESVVEVASDITSKIINGLFSRVSSA